MRRKVPDEPMQTPARILDIEIADLLPDVDAPRRGEGGRYRGALVLIRLHGEPIGTLEVDLTAGPMARSRLAAQIWQSFCGPIREHLARDGFASVGILTEAGIPSEATPACRRFDEASFPFASVVVSTHERPGPLQRCVESILVADYPAFEVLVV